MKSNARVVVIGGGIAGCSTLYHLTREGWNDVVLVERDELTSGTTWHSAAQVTNFGPVQTMVGLKSYSIKLYSELADDAEYPINYHRDCGGIRLAGTQDHLDGYHHFVSMAKGMAVEFEVIDAPECGRRHPLMTTDGLLGGLWDPLDGDIDPAQLCQALARRARNAGAEIYRFNPVQGIYQKPNDEWVVQTENGDITCEKVVNAGGYRVNEVGAMMGVRHPVISMEHQYLVTESIAELEGAEAPVPLIRDPIDDFYSRQEAQGLLVGFYEQDAKTWGMDGIDPDFTMTLCPDDLDRCMDNMERVFERLPCLRDAGIRSVVNGPITYSADGLPLVGPTPGLVNAYSIIGLRAGLGEGGGHGKILADIIVHGEAEWDTWCLDPRRFTAYANTEYTALKAIEDYRNEFRFHYPHEERPAGRPAKTTTLYPLLKAEGAEFSVINGWERVKYFRPEHDFREVPSFRFTNTHDVVKREVETLCDGVGIAEVSGFNRCEVSGPGAYEWLDGLTCSNVPQRAGQLRLAYFLNDNGNVMSEATLASLGDQRFWYGSAAAAEYHDWDWLDKSLPEYGVELKHLTQRHTTLVIAGPRSRELLSIVSPRSDWSRDAFPWLTVQRVFIGYCAALAMCVSYSGELAFELHVPNEQLSACYRSLCEAGEAFGLSRFGLLAIESMRLEKGYRHWKSDLITEFDPIESGLARFVNFDKGEFPGKRALVERHEKAVSRRVFTTLTIDCEVAPAHAGESLLADDKVVGTVTSAGYGFRTDKNIALAYVSPTHASVGTKLDILMLGQRYAAQVCEPCLYDPRNHRLKA